MSYLPPSKISRESHLFLEKNPSVNKNFKFSLILYSLIITGYLMIKLVVTRVANKMEDQIIIILYIKHLINRFFFFGCFEIGSSQCSSGCPSTHNLLTSASWVLGLQVCTSKQILYKRGRKIAKGVLRVRRLYVCGGGRS
jgi:hypothetical protein